jgi:hypothetical protein
LDGCRKYFMAKRIEDKGYAKSDVDCGYVVLFVFSNAVDFFIAS